MAGIAQFFIDGGIWMFPIGLLSILVLAVIVDRIYYLFFVYREDSKTLMQKVQDFVAADDYEPAIELCDKTPNGPLAQVVRRILQSANGTSINEIEIAVEESTMEVMPKVQQRSHTLAGFASLATLLGLLGTVMGLIEAFSVVADAPPDQKSILLTKAISVAMNCTAFGLMVAIPAMFFQLLVGDAVKKILDSIDASTLKLENLLVTKYTKRHSGGAGR